MKNAPVDTNAEDKLGTLLFFQGFIPFVICASNVWRVWSLLHVLQYFWDGIFALNKVKLMAKCKPKIFHTYNISQSPLNPKTIEQQIYKVSIYGSGTKTVHFISPHKTNKT